jgi:hypothetical protein
MSASATELLPLIRDLYSRRPEARCLEAWELRILLWSLGYTDELEDEAEIEAARAVARTDWTGEAA